MADYLKWYNKQDRIVRIIFAVIPFTGWINAIIYRFASGNLISGILAIPFGEIFWIIDLVSVLLNDKIQYAMF